MSFKPPLFRRPLAVLLAFTLGTTGLVHSAAATMVATEEVAAAQPAPVADAAAARARVLAQLDRADLAQALAERGVDVDAARGRVNSLDDAELQQLAAMIDSAPAGASGLVGALVFIFVLLLVTDVLGLTKVFPFTRSVR